MLEHALCKLHTNCARRRGLVQNFASKIALAVFVFLASRVLRISADEVV